MNEHQDFTIVKLSGKNPISNQTNPNKYNIQNKVSDEEKNKNAKLYNIENESENFKIETIPLSISQEIIKGRNAMKLTQKDLAQKLNVQQSIITNYENGKAIPDNQMLQKISKVLNVKFNTKKK
jgi:putative transcription factor